VKWLLVAAALAAAPEHELGVWEMNRAKSSFQPGPAPQRLTETYEAIDSGVRATIEGVDAKGKPFSIRYTAFYDGKEWPLLGSAIADKATFRRIDPNTVERIDRRHGRRVQVVIRVISPDGREAMVIEKGEGWHNMIVYERK
jgi:hypothetical protein